MNRNVKAIYRNGNFIVKEACNIPEGSEVDLIVQGPLVLPPAITDPVEVRRLLVEITERMKQNPLPEQAPRFTREDLHGRR
jgi:hypothetical protein